LKDLFEGWLRNIDRRFAFLYELDFSVDIPVRNRWPLSRATAHVTTRMSAFTGAQKNPTILDDWSANLPLQD
jgi:hypothetical protein